MLRLEVHTVLIRHNDHPRHAFIQQFLGKPTSKDVIEFVEEMPRRDTYQYVIDVMQQIGIPERYVTGDSGDRWCGIGPQDDRRGSIVVRHEPSIPVSSNYSLKGPHDA